MFPRPRIPARWPSFRTKYQVLMSAGRAKIACFARAASTWCRVLSVFCSCCLHHMPGFWPPGDHLVQHPRAWIPVAWCNFPGIRSAIIRSRIPDPGQGRPPGAYAMAGPVAGAVVPGSRPTAHATRRPVGFATARGPGAGWFNS